MKRLTFIALFFIAIPGFCQTRTGVYFASLSGSDRLSIVKNSINVPAWHEKTFWHLYEDYLNEANEVSSLTYRSLTDLALVDQRFSEQEAFENAHEMILNRYELLKTRERYYAEIGSAFNGVIALQFLQAESLLDMMECTRIYEATEWKKFRFPSQAMNVTQLKEAKHNTIRSALALTEDKSEAFWKVYTRYEEECDALLGENYSIISLYAVEPSDFTPGLSKRLGYDFLHLMQRETKLKEKYFLTMNQAVGASLASRFLAWEDYYSLLSKMYAWAEQ